jgi:hypothetical protein
VWAVAVLLAAAAAARAQSAPLTLAVVEQADREQQVLVIREVVTENRPVTREVTVVVNGRLETRTVTENVPVQREQQRELSLKEVRAYDGDGKALEGDALWDRLRRGAVIVSGDVRLLQLPLGKVFRPEAVLLVEVPPRPATAVPAPKENR